MAIVKEVKKNKVSEVNRRRKSLYLDPLEPVLLTETPPVVLTSEQQFYLKEILDLCCSDSKSAEKAYLAISKVLSPTETPAEEPVLTSIEPSGAVIGSPSFDIHVMGTGFTPASIIMFNGLPEPTTFVSETELTTGINMPLWTAPATVPVGVDGSETVDFTFSTAARSIELKEEERKSTK